MDHARHGPRRPRRVALSCDALEDRLCLASSVGWDGPGLGGATLTYYVGTAPSTLGQAAVNAAIRTALNAWSAVANITFVPTTQPNQLRSLDFTFRRLDGAGGTLAQGYFPADVNPGRIAGDVQFDSSERWEVGNALGRSAFDLVRTAVHEIGHALGLDHSNVAGSIMAPTISPTQTFTGLAATDVSAIRRLYAPAGSSALRSAATTPTTTTTTGSDDAPTEPPTNTFPRFRIPRQWRQRASWPTVA